MCVVCMYELAYFIYSFNEIIFRKIVKNMKNIIIIVWNLYKIKRIVKKKKSKTCFSMKI